MPNPFFTIEDKIKECQIKHNNFYDYSKVDYVHSSLKVIISCPIHGDFLQHMSRHALGNGCPDCGKITKAKNRSKETRDSFISKAKNAHPQLDYSKTEYVRSRSKVTITCPKHGDFKALPLIFLASVCGCSKCEFKRVNPKTVTSAMEKIKKIHGNRYDYSLIDYTEKSFHKQKVICKLHGVFEITLGNHMKGGCKACGKISGDNLNREFGHGWNKSNWKRSGEKSKTFDSYKAYVIKCWNDEEVFYKIGRTFNKLKKRFSCKEDLPYKYEPIHIFEYENSDDAFDRETFLHSINKKNKYVPKLKFGGMQECYSKVDII